MRLDTRLSQRQRQTKGLSVRHWPESVAGGGSAAKSGWRCSGRRGSPPARSAPRASIVGDAGAAATPAHSTQLPTRSCPASSAVGAPHAGLRAVVGAWARPRTESVPVTTAVHLTSAQR
eukprot:scaffold527_cov368-Prasinococcus_capsulatus_cf.AAC.39